MSSAYLSPRPPTGLHRDAPRQARGAVETLPLPVRWAIHQGDALALLRRLPSESVQTCVTSPPYFGLRDYGVKGQLGLESRPDCLGWATGQPCGECYICHMVGIFRDVRRVMRDDGTCWLNIGDSYAGSRPSPGRNDTETMYRNPDAPGKTPSGFDKQPQCDVCGRFKRHIGQGWYCDHGKQPYKDKDLLLIPFRLALALQQDGWYVRSDIIWHKRAPMPESVKDRPTKAHEYILMLTKSARYFYDQEAVREELSPTTHGNRKMFRGGGAYTNNNSFNNSAAAPNVVPGNSREAVTNRNLRSVWSLSPDPFPAAHFATFPKSLPELCIKAGTSERGCCPECGKPWVRVVETSGGTTGKSWHDHSHDLIAGMSQYDPTTQKGGVGKARDANGKPYTREEKGWQPQCDHTAPPIPCLVLDPFAGAGTTILVADRLGRRAIGLELNAAYVEMATRRIVDDAPLLMELPA